MMQFTPAKDKLLVEPLDPPKKGSIILPDSARREQRKGVIVAAGKTGISISNGKVIEHPNFFSVGDVIVYQNLDLHDIELDEKKLQLVPMVAVLGTLEESAN